MTVLCEGCGSINVARSRSSRLDKVMRLLTGRKRFTCRRCGWTALRNWHEMPPAGSAPKLVKSEKTRELDIDEFDIDTFH